MGLKFLKEFKPDGEALLRRMSTLVDAATLELIADEDPIGGAARRARHINALRNIRDGGPLLTPSDFASSDKFYDQDVRELLRFSCSGDPEAMVGCGVAREGIGRELSPAQCCCAPTETKPSHIAKPVPTTPRPAPTQATPTQT